MNLPATTRAGGHSREKRSALSARAWLLLLGLLFLLTIRSHAAERNYWRNKGGDYAQTAATAWEAKAGSKTFHFAEINRTPEYVELWDKETNVTIRLFDNHYEERRGEGPFVVKQQGQWETRSTSGATPSAALTVPVTPAPSIRPPAAVPSAGGPPAPSAVPSPAAVRDYWRNKGGDFEHLAGVAWDSKSRDKVHHFVETARTPEYVELLDQETNVSVRLFNDHYEDRHGSGPYVVKQEGKWESKAASDTAVNSGATAPAAKPPSIVSTMDDYKAQVFTGPGGKTLPYRLLTPYGYDKSRRYPLVLFLHGFGEKGTDNKAQLKHCVELFIKPAVREQYPCFVLVPQTPFTWVMVPDHNKPQKYDPKPVEAMALTMDVLARIMREYSVDPARLYLSGASNGAYGVWELLEREPQRWAAAVPMCGGGDPSRIAVARDVPIWAFHGDKDPTIPVARSREMIAALKAAGGNPKYTEYPGMGHMPVAYKAYTEKELLPWLFAQRRP